MANTGTTIKEIKKDTGYSLNWVRAAARKAAKDMTSIAKKNAAAKSGGDHEPARFNKSEVKAIKSQFTRRPNPRAGKKASKK